MEFLTQQFYAPHSIPSPSEGTSPTAAATGPETVVGQGADGASATSSVLALEQQHERFHKLLQRTKSEGSNSKRSSIALPSLKNRGTWRSFGKVQGTVKVWEHGTLTDLDKVESKRGTDKKKRDELKDREWSMTGEGTIWIEKGDLVFIFTNLPSISASPRSKRDQGEAKSHWWNQCCTSDTLFKEREHSPELQPPIEIEGRMVTAIRIPKEHILCYESSVEVPDENLSLKRSRSVAHSEKSGIKDKSNEVVQVFSLVPLHIQAARSSKDKPTIRLEEFEGCISFSFNEVLMNTEAIELVRRLQDWQSPKQ